MNGRGRHGSDRVDKRAVWIKMVTLYNSICPCCERFIKIYLKRDNSFVQNRTLKSGKICVTNLSFSLSLSLSHTHTHVLFLSLSLPPSLSLSLSLSHTHTFSCLSLSLSHSHIHTHAHTFVLIYIVCKVGDRSRWRPESSFFNSYYTRCRGGRYSFLFIASLYPWYVPYIDEC